MTLRFTGNGQYDRKTTMAFMNLLQYSLESYANHKLLPIPGTTAKQLLLQAAILTGKTYNRSQYNLAAADIKLLSLDMKSAAAGASLP